MRPAIVLMQIGTIDKDHLSVTIKNLEENTGYAFNISNRNAPSSDRQSNVMQEFKFETASGNGTTARRSNRSVSFLLLP